MYKLQSTSISMGAKNGMITAVMSVVAIRVVDIETPF